MKQFIRDYLTFNKRERNGVFVLMSIIVLLLLYLNVSSGFVRSQSVDFSKFEKQMDSMQTATTTIADSEHEAEPKLYRHREKEMNEMFPSKEKKISERFPFDPNNLPDSDWKRLGLSDKQIKTIKNYESKGGKFRKKEDVKKMYCIKPDLYASLEPYIQFQQAPQKIPLEETHDKVDRLRTTVSQLQTIIELNSADSATLITIKGIGPFYAKSIIKYRNELGGYVAKEQLLELWKFDQEKFNGIEKYISVDPSVAKKIKINSCTADELRHPYLKWNQANGIVNYRRQHGKFKTIEDIRQTDLVDDETLRKIAAYLIVD